MVLIPIRVTNTKSSSYRMLGINYLATFIDLGNLPFILQTKLIILIPAI